MVTKLLPLINSSIDRFKKTLIDLTDITKLQRLSEEDITEVDIRAVIEDIELDLSDSIANSNTEIVLEISGSSVLLFSSKNIRSIIYNLISNSIKYRSPERPPLININCYSEGNYFIVSVKDNGLGMKVANRHNIFEMFKRMHNHVEGSGVGLYIVKRIMDNAAGKIEVESEVNKGSTFKLFFKK